MLMNIRPETPQDYAAIATVNCRAFGFASAEPAIIALSRSRARFDPELSLVAEKNGEIVGHVLYTPESIRLLREWVKAVLLAPIAIDPAHQRKGIGAALMAEGHRIAREKGYALSFLVGHPSYYPRFGYRQNAFGGSSLTVDVTEFEASGLMARPPVENDVPVLRDLWLHEEGEVDFAIDPGDSILDWLSPTPAVKAQIYERGGQIVGYTRADTEQVRLFLARDTDAARGMARLLAETQPQITLPLHPFSASASAFGTPVTGRWEFGMALSLVPSPYDEYERLLASGERPPGRPQWSAVFDIA